MKKFFLLLILLVSFTSNAQDWIKQFPYEQPQLLLNKRVKVAEKKLSLQKYGYDHFYTTESLELRTNYKSKGSYNTPYDDLVNKEFMVISVKPHINAIGKSKFKLELFNDEIGTLWYEYDPIYSHGFPFLILGNLDIKMP